MKILLILILPFCVIAQTPRVLIVGDSWAQQQFDDHIHNQVFANSGYPDIVVADSSSTAINGKEAADWVMPSQLQIIADALAANPLVDTVQLTLGGNDFLNNWNINLSAAQEQVLKQQIADDLTTIIEFILAQNDAIEVILSFYDYPNFVDTIGGIAGGFCSNLHNDLGQPTPNQLNAKSTEFEQAYANVATANPRVFYVSHSGLMQSYYGFPDDGIQPGELMPPGDISRPSPVEAMRNFVITRDCFHLSPQSYGYLIQDTFDGYFHTRFDTVFKHGFE